MRIKFADSNMLTSVRRKLIVITCIILSAMAVTNVALYYNSVQSSYATQLNQYNDNLVNQIGKIYEQTLFNTLNEANRVLMFDAALSRAVRENEDYDSRTGIIKTLRSLIATDDTIHSVYFYVPSSGLVYSTNFGSLNALEGFSDKDYFMRQESNLLISEPRIVQESHGNSLVISVSTPLSPGSSSQKNARLVVNIDARKLYSNICSRVGVDDNMQLMLLSVDNVIIGDYSDADLFTEPEIELYKMEKQNLWLSGTPRILSTYKSSSLSWTFLLNTRIDFEGQNLLRFVLITTGIIFFIMIITIFAIYRFTNPVQHAISHVGLTLLRDILTENIDASPENLKKLAETDFVFERSQFCALLLSFGEKEHDPAMLRTGSEQIAALASSYGLIPKVMDINRKQTVVILPLPMDALAYYSEQLELLFEALSEYEPLENIIIGISSIKNNPRELSAAFKECLEIQKYNIFFGSNVLKYTSFIQHEVDLSSLMSLSDKLSQNLLSGKMQEAEELINQLLESIVESSVPISDMALMHSAKSFENQVLGKFSGIPLKDVKELAKISEGTYHNIDEFGLAYKSFVLGVCGILGRSNMDNEILTLKTIVDYINTNFTDNSLNLTRLATDLSLNRNYAGKLIKSTSGETFTEYLNRKRVSLAKELLAGSSTVEEASVRVGFSYSYYFIKIFKELEGTTPGQYKKDLQAKALEND